ncbi:uncharacterized protein LOC129618693 [Condylostylus longicornis]|uniref:uncharacterized protein LOC129618693 n=1 Tax=Condylostylus longicornis TaxID=2530218 RepID=UPI00244E3DE5|nr:uncharacterized protein LOC129618693 [Condylostylus longicornis]
MNHHFQGTLERKTRASQEEYRAKRREEKKVVKRKKRDHARSRLLDIEKHRDRAEVRSFYRKRKQLSAGFKPYTCALDDGAGNLVTDEEGILRAWKQHFERLLNSENTESDASTRNTPVNNEEVIPPSLEEVNNAIQKLKNNKAAGSDGLFKAGGDVLVRSMHQIIYRIWMEESMPDEWSVSIIRPIHKKDDTTSCNIYRGISLINIGYKILPNSTKRVLPIAISFFASEFVTKCILTNSKAAEHHVTKSNIHMCI